MLSIQRDPLFGIVIILAIIALVALADFWRMRYYKKSTSKSLLNLAKSYDFKGANEDLETSLKLGVETFLNLGKNAIPTLKFVAQSYERSGETQEAIKIYLSILEYLKTTKDKLDVLQSLGKAYHKAGFLQRAKDIFLEILKTQPRNMDILLYLMRTYENLGEYKNAIQALECIEELYAIDMDTQINIDADMKENISLNKTYLHMLIQSSDIVSDASYNTQMFLRYKKKEPKLQKIVMKYLKANNIEVFWEEANLLSEIATHDMIDVFWHIDKKDIPFDKLNNPHVLEIYLAKGYIKADEKLDKCQDFELEKKRLLDTYSSFKTNLSFEYRCDSCKYIFPFDNARCPMCSELLNISLIYKVKNIKGENNEKNYSLL